MVHCSHVQEVYHHSNHRKSGNLGSTGDLVFPTKLILLTISLPEYLSQFPQAGFSDVQLPDCLWDVKTFLYQAKKGLSKNFWLLLLISKELLLSIYIYTKAGSTLKKKKFHLCSWMKRPAIYWLHNIILSSHDYLLYPFSFSIRLVKGRKWMRNTTGVSQIQWTACSLNLMNACSSTWRNEWLLWRIRLKHTHTRLYCI